ncbi:nucleotidyltransferase domain-containing protein [Paenibacillus sp. KN14-4R]|uniref:nucleotidyltransferase domain-containing protein n=1 Tax=Paenibacillus sp. KN14-4R TaxID=3445773 RepID=UPI003FA0E89E
MIFPVENLTREHILEMVKEVVLAPFSNTTARVYLIGSWAHGKEKRTSDIDVAIWYDSSDAEEVLSDLRTELEESLIPYRVDVVNLNLAGPKMNRKAEEGIVWKD